MRLAQELVDRCSQKVELGMALDDPAQWLGVAKAARAAVAQGPLEATGEGRRREMPRGTGAPSVFAKISASGSGSDPAEAHSKSKWKLDVARPVLALDQVDPLALALLGERADLARAGGSLNSSLSILTAEKSPCVSSAS